MNAPYPKVVPNSLALIVPTPARTHSIVATLPSSENTSRGPSIEKSIRLIVTGTKSLSGFLSFTLTWNNDSITFSRTRRVDYQLNLMVLDKSNRSTEMWSRALHYLETSPSRNDVMDPSGSNPPAPSSITISEMGRPKSGSKPPNARGMRKVTVTGSLNSVPSGPSS